MKGLRVSTVITTSFDARSEQTADEAALERRNEVNDLLTGTFNSILRIEEQSLNNRIMQGLSITEVHTLVAIGLHEQNPMSVVAARLGVTLATLTTAVNKLESRGFVKRVRDEVDRRKVLVSLTLQGKKVFRAHELFHHRMLDEALQGLSEEEELVLIKSLGKVKSFFDSTMQSESGFNR